MREAPLLLFDPIAMGWKGRAEAWIIICFHHFNLIVSFYGIEFRAFFFFSFFNIFIAQQSLLFRIQNFAIFIIALAVARHVIYLYLIMRFTSLLLQ
jgi:hypothetical protein